MLYQHNFDNFINNVNLNLLDLYSSIPGPWFPSSSSSLGPGLADPMVLVNPGPSKAEGCPVGFVAFLGREL